jgi:hypothetical protein
VRDRAAAVKAAVRYWSTMAAFLVTVGMLLDRSYQLRAFDSFSTYLAAVAVAVTLMVALLAE